MDERLPRSPRASGAIAPRCARIPRWLARPRPHPAPPALLQSRLGPSEVLIPALERLDRLCDGFLQRRVAASGDLRAQPVFILSGQLNLHAARLLLFARRIYRLSNLLNLMRCGSTLEGQDGRGHAIEEEAVVADDDGAAREGGLRSWSDLFGRPLASPR
jgi:hypothetical protein